MAASEFSSGAVEVRCVDMWFGWEAVSESCGAVAVGCASTRAGTVPDAITGTALDTAARCAVTAAAQLVTDVEGALGGPRVHRIGGGSGSAAGAGAGAVGAGTACVAAAS